MNCHPKRKTNYASFILAGSWQRNLYRWRLRSRGHHRRCGSIASMIYGLVWEPFTGRETIPCANWEILNKPKFWLEFGYDAMSRMSKTLVEDFLLREPKFLQTVELFETQIQRKLREAQQNTPQIVTKLGSLHSASAWPPFRLWARSVAKKIAPAPAPDFQPTGLTP
jgi:hypothetical protein